MSEVAKTTDAEALNAVESVEQNADGNTVEKVGKKKKPNNKKAKQAAGK